MEQSRKVKDKKAQYKLGSLYFKKVSIRMLVANAFQLFKKSAKQGFTDAAYAGMLLLTRAWECRKITNAL